MSVTVTALFTPPGLQAHNRLQAQEYDAHVMLNQEVLCHPRSAQYRQRDNRSSDMTYATHVMLVGCLYSCWY